MKLLQLISLLSLFIGAPASSMVSEALIKTKEESGIFIIGTYHDADSNQAQRQAQCLVGIMLQRNPGMAPIALIIEANKRIIQEGKDPLINRIIQEVTSLKKQAKTNIELIAAEERSDMSGEIATRFILIAQMFNKKKSFAPDVIDSSLTNDLIINAQIKASFVNNPTFTVREFFKYLDSNLTFMKDLQRAYASTNSVIAKEIQDYSAAHERINLLLQNEDPQEEIGVAIIKLFFRCNTLAKLESRYCELSKLFLSDTDDNYANFVFLKRVLELYRKNVIWLVLGGIHASKLIEILPHFDMEIIHTRSIAEITGQRATLVDKDYSTLLALALVGAEEFIKMQPVLEKSLSHKQCAQCLKENCTSHCGKCKTTYYCSSDCQKKNRKEHKKNCVK